MPLPSKPSQSFPWPQRVTALVADFLRCFQSGPAKTSDNAADPQTTTRRRKPRRRPFSALPDPMARSSANRLQ